MGSKISESQIFNEMDKHLADVQSGDLKNKKVAIRNITDKAAMDLMRKNSDLYTGWFMQEQVAEKLIEVLQNETDKDVLTSWIWAIELTCCRQWALAQTSIGEPAAVHYINKAKKQVNTVYEAYKDVPQIAVGVLKFHKSLYKQLGEKTDLEQVKTLYMQAMELKLRKPEKLLFCSYDLFDFSDLLKDNAFANQVEDYIIKIYWEDKSLDIKRRIGYILLEAQCEKGREVVADYRENNYFTSNNSHIEKLYQKYAEKAMA